MNKVLIIDDDVSLLDVLSLAFEDAGYEVITARDGIAGLGQVTARTPDVVVSDINMPGLDGFTLCKRLREQHNDVPLILLTSRDSEIDESLGLELGADDYITKPFSTRILLARVAAVLRRQSMRTEPQEQPVVCGRLELFAERLEVRYDGQPLRTTVTEFRLIQALVKRPGRVYSRQQLLSTIRGDDSVVVDRIVDTYIRRLRRMFESVDPKFESIETVVGLGYRWRDG